MRTQGMLPILVAALLVGSSAAAQQAPIGHRQPKLSDLPRDVARREQASQPQQSQRQTSAGLAKGGGPPTIDIQKTCRESSSALVGLTGNDSQDTFISCMNDEQTARDQLVKDWATYPALAKSACINPNEYLPGYVEWQSCIEMTRDVIQLRKDQAASAPADSDASGQSSSRRTGSKSGECPIVHTADDGSIDWVITNC